MSLLHQQIDTLASYAYEQARNLHVHAPKVVDAKISLTQLGQSSVISKCCFCGGRSLGDRQHCLTKSCISVTFTMSIKTETNDKDTATAANLDCLDCNFSVTSSVRHAWRVLFVAGLISMHAAPANVCRHSSLSSLKCLESAELRRWRRTKTWWPFAGFWRFVAGGQFVPPGCVLVADSNLSIAFLLLLLKNKCEQLTTKVSKVRYILQSYHSWRAWIILMEPSCL